jgi:putative transposase
MPIGMDDVIRIIALGTRPMPYDPNKHHRRSIRLDGYDYSRVGVYYVTICVQGRACLLGNVVDGSVRLSPDGVLVDNCWRRISAHFPNVVLDAWIVMPNHLHGLIKITPPPPNIPARTLGQVVAWFKYQSTCAVDEQRGEPVRPLWQRNYYEHVVRDDADLERIRAYIAHNPRCWQPD